MLKLNLGCGGDIRPGYQNIDKFDLRPGAIEGDITNLSPLYQPGTVDEIVAQDVLEHIPFGHTQRVLAHWASLLKVGGRIVVRVPDMDKQIECYKTGVWSHRRFVYMFFGGETHAGNFHFNAFTAKDLVERMRSVGLEPTRVNFLHENLVDHDSSWNANFELEAYKSVVIGSGSDSVGLGDLLLLTPICTEFPGTVVQLPPRAERFAPLFHYLARVELTHNPVCTPNVGDGHFAMRKLRAVGRGGASCIPRMAFAQEEIDKARNFLARFENPVAVVVNCAPTWKHVREMDFARWQEIIDRLGDRHTLLQFGLSNNIHHLRGVRPLLDLPVRDLACCFFVIGKYLGVDTGDMHLMLAAGGRVVALVPPSSPLYEHDQWHYRPEYWGGQPPRIKYVLFDDYRTVPDELSFLDQVPTGA
jgi:hypothetical protein